MLRNMLSSGLSMGFMSSLVNIGTLTLQTSINKLGQNIIICPYGSPQDLRDLHDHVQRLRSDNGDLLRTKSGSRQNRTDPQRNLLATGYTCIWCTLNIVTAYTIGDWLVWWSPAAKLRK